MYTYELTVDDDFFATFEASPIQRADVQLTLTVDRRTRDMVLEFDFSGTVATDCDRCLAAVDFPIEGHTRLVAKFTTEAKDAVDEEDLILLDPDVSLFNVAPYAYEIVVLALPMIRTFDCQAGEPPYPCDEEMLNRIDAWVDYAPTDEDPGEDDEEKPGPWDVLKDIK